MHKTMITDLFVPEWSVILSPGDLVFDHLEGLCFPLLLVGCAGVGILTIILLTTKFGTILTTSLEVYIGNSYILHRVIFVMRKLTIWTFMKIDTLAYGNIRKTHTITVASLLSLSCRGRLCNLSISSNDRISPLKTKKNHDVINPTIQFLALALHRLTSFGTKTSILSLLLFLSILLPSPNPIFFLKL